MLGQAYEFEKTREKMTAFVWALAVVAVSLCNAHIHSLSFKDDSRRSVLIESFGFDEGGYQSITNTAVKVKLVG
jgi:hypothetical protein